MGKTQRSLSVLSKFQRVRPFGKTAWQTASGSIFVLTVVTFKILLKKTVISKVSQKKCGDDDDDDDMPPQTSSALSVDLIRPKRLSKLNPNLGTKVCQPWNSSIHANDSAAVSSSLSPAHGIFKVSYRKVRWCKLLKKAWLLRFAVFSTCLSSNVQQICWSSSPPDLSLIFEHLQVSGCPWSLPDNVWEVTASLSPWLALPLHGNSWRALGRCHRSSHVKGVLNSSTSPGRGKCLKVAKFHHCHWLPRSSYLLQHLSSPNLCVCNSIFFLPLLQHVWPRKI